MLPGVPIQQQQCAFSTKLVQTPTEQKVDLHRPAAGMAQVCISRFSVNMFDAIFMEALAWRLAAAITWR